MRLLMATILILAGLSGCFGNEFSWPTPQPHDCQSQQSITCTTIWDGFTTPVYVTHAGDGTGDLYVVDQIGLIWQISEGEIGDGPFLDVRKQVTTCHVEQGLLGLAFAPDYTGSGTYYVAYTMHQKKCPGPININEDLYGKGDLVLMRFQRGDDGADGHEMLRIPEPYRNHNGGYITHGPDGFLYLGVGDGGDHGDPLGTGQDPDDLLGSILRLNVTGDTAAAAEGNPFDGDGAMVWAYGLRNPWRFAFDEERLWVADVGQDCWEELNLVVNAPGLNFGWSEYEGNTLFTSGQRCSATQDIADHGDAIRPLYTYGRDAGCSITGGVIAPASWGNLSGQYLFADFCFGTLWAAAPDGTVTEIMNTGLQVTSFGQDASGEVYLTHWGGSLHRLDFTA